MSGLGVGRQQAFQRGWELQARHLSFRGPYVRQLTHTLARNVRPTWSPDGRQIAFISARDDNPELYVMNTDRTAQRGVTSGGGNIGSRIWSPDDTLILFNSDRTGQLELYAMDFERLFAHQFTHGPRNEFNGVRRPLSNPSDCQSPTEATSAWRKPSVSPISLLSVALLS